MILLDTDHLSVLGYPRHPRAQGLALRLGNAPEPVSLPIVAVEEQCRGWLNLIRRASTPAKLVDSYGRFLEFVESMKEWTTAGYSPEASFIHEALRAQIRISSADLKIAPIALARGALLLTANLRDFRKVPGLRAESWI